MFYETLKWIGTAITNCYSWLAAILVAWFTYFMPIKDMLGLIILFFTVEMFMGYLAARKLRGEPFRLSIVFTKTIPRLALVIFMMLGTYLWDVIFSQELVHTYSILGWTICGILLVSIFKKGHTITGWRPFKTISNTIKSNIGNKVKI